jgi:hypothetical protein
LLPRQTRLIDEDDYSALSRSDFLRLATAFLSRY